MGSLVFCAHCMCHYRGGFGGNSPGTASGKNHRKV